MFLKNLLVFSLTLSYLISQVLTLTCYKSDSFNPKEPGEETEECEEGNVCLRYVEMSEGTPENDTMKCGTKEECEAGISEGTVAHCLVCETDKCIPEITGGAGGDGGGDASTEEEVTDESTETDDSDESEEPPLYSPPETTTLIVKKNVKKTAKNKKKKSSSPERLYCPSIGVSLVFLLYFLLSPNV
ncbi:hypothetical protein HHI36_003912 [Cryptolaemus montrouzieri]|uniref:Uncharacterized protein n=1 Tax=Cryptolaemus montrouzieri TaxID=559131 RepID=A0ABD2NPY0_9CUCU